MKLTISQNGAKSITIDTDNIKSTEAAYPGAAGIVSNYIGYSLQMAATRYVMKEFPKLAKAIYSKCADYVPNVTSMEDFAKNEKFLKSLDRAIKKYEKDGFPTLTEVENNFKATTKSKFICNLFDSHKDPNIDAGARNMNISLRKIHEVPVCIVKIRDPHAEKRGVRYDVLASTMFVGHGDKIKSIPLSRAEINKRFNG